MFGTDRMLFATNIFMLSSAVCFGILIKVLVPGEMSEWFMEPVLKTGDAERHRGFESLSLRQHSIKILL